MFHILVLSLHFFFYQNVPLKFFKKDSARNIKNLFKVERKKSCTTSSNFEQSIMLLRTVDKHLICTVFTAPILDRNLRKAPSKISLILCKKLLITYISLRNCYYFGSVIYICNYFFFLEKKIIYYSLAFFRVQQLYFTLQPPAIFSSIFPLHTYYYYNTQNISSYYYITPQF